MRVNSLQPKSLNVLKKKVAIVTDGASSLAPTQGEPYELAIAPVYVNFGEQTYQSGVNLDAAEFYQMLRTSKDLPTTAQPTAQDFVNLYARLTKDVDEIVTVVISHHMSATIRSALMAKEQFTEVSIHVIDSESVMFVLGMMCIAVTRVAAEGQDAQQIIQLLEQIKQNMTVIFTVDILKYLHKGGRIGGGAAFLGSALNIKPILYHKDGRIEPLERQRTRTRAVSRLLELVEERIGKSKTHFAVFHCEAEQAARDFSGQLQEKFDCAELIISEAGPVIGTHAGPGTLGLAFYTLP